MASFILALLIVLVVFVPWFYGLCSLLRDVARKLKSKKGGKGS